MDNKQTWPFTGIRPKLASKILSNENVNYKNITHATNGFEIHEMGTLKVLKLVEKLTIRKASGLDNIPVRLLKLSAPTTIESLT